MVFIFVDRYVRRAYEVVYTLLHKFSLEKCQCSKATTSCKNSGDTSPSWGVINFPIISHTAATLPPLSVLLARQKYVGN